MELLACNGHGSLTEMYLGADGCVGLADRAILLSLYGTTESTVW